VLTVSLLSHRNLKLTRNMIKAELVIIDWKSRDMALCFIVKTRGGAARTAATRDSGRCDGGGSRQQRQA
jgi:hypothetical protein